MADDKNILNKGGILNMGLINKAERKFGRFAIKNLMMYISVTSLVIFFIEYFDLFTLSNPGGFIGLIILDINKVYAGEIWRLITFIFVPPTMSPFWILFSVYFPYIIGTQLENSWGAFRFNLYYLTGLLGCIAASIITGGYADTFFLNMSLFFAFAVLYPNSEMLLLFVLPIKSKFLALFNAALFVGCFWKGSLVFIGSYFWLDEFSVRVTILMSLLNILLFLTPRIWNNIKRFFAFRKTRSQFRRHMRK